MMKFKGLSTSAKQEILFATTLGKKTLKDFVGRDSWILFQLMDLDSIFLVHPATKWKTLESYQKKNVFNVSKGKCFQFACGK